MYIGRFAPSPTGPLHFGSLLTAVASYCDAKHHQGQWLVRIENTDTQRNVPHTDTLILNMLERYGLQWDGEVTYQLQRTQYYENALDFLQQNNHTYACVCSRKQLAGQIIYPKNCWHAPPLTQAAGAHTRVHIPEHTPVVCFTDAIQGVYCQNIVQEVGDFILKRRDGIYSYQLAVVVDDLCMRISHVVRGADLLDNTPRQRWLRQLLQKLFAPQAPLLHYAHIPLAVNALGQKLSKQNLSAPISAHNSAVTLHQALSTLGQSVDFDVRVDVMLAQAVQTWSLQAIPKTLAFTQSFV